MLTLLQINSVVTYGSTGRVVEELGDSVMAMGWESYIAYGRYDRRCKSNLIRVGSNKDVIIHGLNTRLFDRHGLSSTKATKQLIDGIEEINPTIIHLQTLHGYYLNIRLLFEYLSMKNIPVVWTLHDCWPLTGHCAYFDFVGCIKWKTSCFNCPQKNTYPVSYLVDRSRKNHELKKELFTSLRNLTIVTVSGWLANIIKQSFLSEYPVQIINNGVNTGIFKPVEVSVVKAKYGLKDKFILLGVASRWTLRKRLQDYIQLSTKLDPSFHIILVGVSNSQIRKLPSNITGIERTEDINELVGLYSSADILLNLSFEETFGFTTVEGFACGTPGIVYNTTASPELITPETGCIVEKGDIEGLVDAINLMKAKGKAQYTTACLARVMKLYNKDDRYQEYIDLYNCILKKLERQTIEANN